MVVNRPKNNYSCIIVDDDEIDRLTILSYTRKYPFLQIDGVFESAKEAISFNQNSTVDVLLLDIDIPDLNGLDLRKQLEHVPACIFITSHPEYALDSFETSGPGFPG